MGLVAGLALEVGLELELDLGLGLGMGLGLVAGMELRARSDDVLNEERRDICSGHRFRGRDEDCHFGETIHHHQDCIVVETGWQVRYPV